MENKPNEKPKNPKILLVVLIILAVVAVGLFAGFASKHFIRASKANFRSRPGNNFMMKDRSRLMGGRQYKTGRISGEITKISGNDLTVKDSNNKEINVTVIDTTSIYNNKEISSLADLKVGAKVTVTGRPNSSGAVQAREISIN